MGHAWVDDRLYLHPKAVEAGVEAMGLWVLALSYGRHHETGGAISVAVCARLTGDREQAERGAAALVRAGLWEPTPTGYQFHDWLDHQTPERQAPPRGRRSAKAHPTDSGSGSGSAASQTPSVPPPAKQPGLPGVDLPEPAAKPKARPLAVADAIAALSRTAGSRVALGTRDQWTGGHVIAIQKHVKKFPTVETWERLGAWLAASNRSRMGTVGMSWVASADLASAVIEADAWHAAGRPDTPTVAGPASTGRRPWVAPLAPATSFEDDGEADRLLDEMARAGRPAVNA